MRLLVGSRRDLVVLSAKNLPVIWFGLNGWCYSKTVEWDRGEDWKIGRTLSWWVGEGQRIWMGGDVEVKGFGETVGWWWVGESERTVEDLERQWANGLCFPITGTDPAALKCQLGCIFTNNVKHLMALHSAGSVGYLSSRILSCSNPFLVPSFFTSGGVKEWYHLLLWAFVESRSI